MSYRLPPLNGLRAFEASARHLSFKRAAEELSVTPGAVSQQVKHLEEALGVPLFQRGHRSLTLTEHGRELRPAVGEAFELLSAAGDRIARHLKGRVLRLGVSPRLCADPERAMALLARRRRPPEYVRVSCTDDIAHLSDGSVDAILRLSPGSCPGMHVEPIRLRDGFARQQQAVLVVWPGLKHCREFLKVKALLSQP
jgi:LysR family transcriptional regulator, glycine cleavage system transcriptional activator